MPSEIKAWAELSGRHLRPWQFAALIAMDRKWLAKADADRAKAIEDADPNKPKMIAVDDTASLAAFFKSQPGRDVSA